MPLSRPTLTELVDRAKGHIKTELGLVTVIRRTFAYALAKAVAGLSHMLHGHLVYVSRQIFPDQAEQEYITRMAAIFGIVQNAASFAQLTVQFTGTNGSVIPLGTILQRGDGLTYLTDAVLTIASGTASGTITAVTGGSTSNLEVNDTVSLQSPTAGVNADATVTAIVLEGEDEETDESLRERLISRMQNPPSGGTAADYIAWAREVPGVTRAWVLPGYYGSGTVGVAFVEGAGEIEIPAPAKVDEVQTYIVGKAPVTAQVTTFAPIASPLNLTIALSPNNADVQAAVLAELKDLFFRDAHVRGSYKHADATNTGKIPLSKINEAISLALGEDDHSLVSPTSDFTPPANGYVATLGTVTWQPL